ncbi:expressed unknown protein [Seminavis robusta]|uniref:Uncharacterized protein n=1 Tax=Seminavis robusta TaxID=568900 RepID=A0A9N8HVD4_9STRA|nr:expressed unknown protein [Seminavis robusta]|eukprot:Sro1786_g297410.1 n/a (197) ;mRNA; r:7694-8284
MKNAVIATLLSLFLVLSLSSAADVAELRRLRALGWHNGGNGGGGHHGNGHHGGDNGRDHPNKYNNNMGNPVPAPLDSAVGAEAVGVGETLGIESAADPVPAPAPLESSAQAQALESSESTYSCNMSKGAIIAVGVVCGIILLVGFFCAFFSGRDGTTQQSSKSAMAATKSVAVPTKEQPDEISLEDMTAASEPSEA